MVGDERQAGEKRRERQRKWGWGWYRAKSKPANHEAESAYVTGEGGAAENVVKFSEICVPPSPSVMADAKVLRRSLAFIFLKNFTQNELFEAD